jgi:hypothetical protein
MPVETLYLPTIVSQLLPLTTVYVTRKRHIAEEVYLETVNPLNWVTLVCSVGIRILYGRDNWL